MSLSKLNQLAYPSLDQFYKLLVKELREQCQNCSNLTLRLALLESIEPLFEFDLFRRSIVEDYRELAPIYLRYIQMPAYLNDISDRLKSRNDVVPFFYVGDALSQLCLVSYNCRFFNRENTQILEICTQYEQKLVTCVNDWMRKAEKQPPKLFRQYNELHQIVFHFFHPVRVPSILPRKQNKARSPYLEEIYNLVKKLKMLPETRYSFLIAAFLREADNVKFNGAGILLTDAIEIDFLRLKPALFWWFFDIVQENFAALHSAENEREMNKAIQRQMYEEEICREKAYSEYLEIVRQQAEMPSAGAAQEDAQNNYESCHEVIINTDYYMGRRAYQPQRQASESLEQQRLRAQNDRNKREQQAQEMQEETHEGRPEPTEQSTEPDRAEYFGQKGLEAGGNQGEQESQQNDAYKQ